MTRVFRKRPAKDKVGDLYVDTKGKIPTSKAIIKHLVINYLGILIREVSEYFIQFTIQKPKPNNNKKKIMFWFWPNARLMNKDCSYFNSSCAKTPSLSHKRRRVISIISAYAHYPLNAPHHQSKLFFIDTDPVRKVKWKKNKLAQFHFDIFFNRGERIYI